uniref:chloroplastic import inner membrane translocase subunit HP30-2-like n=1 Tax=Erigeron canadensis TaxID=72917 RepID=UPI001CB90BF1|nr:chloroplastic import inner membrane translocase subunit HP30-2-like [Erigeron canadensis]
MSYIGDEKKQGVLTVYCKRKQAVDDFEIRCKKFNNWVSRQSLPVKAAVATITGTVPGAIMGVILETLFEGYGYFRGYKPLVQSFVAGGPLENVRNFAVFTGVKSGISCVMKNLRGKEDVQSSFVAGFGSGVTVSLVSGMRGPSVLSVGLVFALGSAGLFKLEEKYSEKEDVSHDKTRGVFSCMGLGHDNYPMNFNSSLITDSYLVFDERKYSSPSDETFYTAMI